jgi:hypothetical protein
LGQPIPLAQVTKYGCPTSVVPLGTGIRLLAADDYPPGARQAESTDDDHAQQLAPEWEHAIQVGAWAYRPPGPDFDDDDDDDGENR